MLLKILICVGFLNYATCRTARDYREMPENARLSQAQYPSYNIHAPDGPGTYAFGYEIEDHATGNVQFRDEEKLRNGTVRGSYGVLHPDSTLHITRYIADQFGYRAKSETRKGAGPLKLELQLQPLVVGQTPYPIRPQQNVFGNSPSTTPFPDPFETVKPNIDPAFAAALYQQRQIDINPSYNVLRDQNVIDPQTANALLQHQFYAAQNPQIIGFRQNSDGSVSTIQTSSQNRPPFNWFGNNNNNNNQYEQQQQQGPIMSLLANIAQNNPITGFLNNFQQQPQSDQQNQNPFQNFISNLNPFNLFSQNNNNNNRPQQPTSSNIQAAIQSDYISPSNMLSNNIDNSAFSNDHFLNPSQFVQNGNYNPGYVSSAFNRAPSGLQPQLYNSNYNPSGSYINQISSSGYPSYNQQFSSLGNGQPFSQFSLQNPMGNGQQFSQFASQNPSGYDQQFSQFSLQNPSGNGQQFSLQNPTGSGQQFSQFSTQNPSGYPIYQNPYQSISPISIGQVPNFNQKKKTHVKTSKKKNNKNKVDVPDTDSPWFQDFLDKRKEASLEVTSKRPVKKASEEDDDDFDDYFR